MATTIFLSKVIFFLFRNLMENYFVRLSWDIVRACQYHIPLADIFAMASPEDANKAEIKNKNVLVRTNTSKKADSETAKFPIDGILLFCDSWKNNYRQVS